MISRGHRGCYPDDAHGHEFCREEKFALLKSFPKELLIAAHFIGFDPGGRVAPYIPAYSAQATESRNGLVVTPRDDVRRWMSGDERSEDLDCMT